MLTVGLTGGLASGKSVVAEIFAEMGARVAHADKMGHETLLRGGEAFDAVVAEFGPSILNPEGEIDRKSLGASVFPDPVKLKKLNALIHPHVFRRQQRFFGQVAEQDPDAVAVVEAAIMIESGSYRKYDRIVVAICPQEKQIQRFMEREQATREEALARIERQMPLEKKKTYADYIVDTSGALEQTRERAAAVYLKLKAEAASRP